MSVQTNVKNGQIVLLAAEDMDSKQSHLVKIVNQSGTPAAQLPDSIDDLAFYVVIDGGASGENGKVRVLPTDAGSYRGLMIAEEAGIDGQLIKARPAPLGVITVTV
jgi:hypothetical protein